MEDIVWEEPNLNEEVVVIDSSSVFRVVPQDQTSNIFTVKGTIKQNLLKAITSSAPYWSGTTVKYTPLANVFVLFYFNLFIISFYILQRTFRSTFEPDVAPIVLPSVADDAHQRINGDDDSILDAFAANACDSSSACNNNNNINSAQDSDNSHPSGWLFFFKET